MCEPLPQPEPPAAAERLRRLTERARGGDAGALAALRAALDEAPEVWRRCGDLAACAERAWVDLAAGPDPLMREALARTLEQLKAELASPATTPLEGLLVQRVAACWVQVQYCDAVAAQARHVSTRQAELATERQDRAQRRYLAAVAALANLRRLLPAGGGRREGVRPVTATRGTGTGPAGHPATVTGIEAAPMPVAAARPPSTPTGGAAIPTRDEPDGAPDLDPVRPRGPIRPRAAHTGPVPPIVPFSIPIGGRHDERERAAGERRDPA